ncbi:MAG: hypothetical protein ABI665_03800 [Vicinamibacterales bacterium]
MNASLETTTLKFTTLMKDSDQAASHVKDLFEIAKKTPFETGPIIEASLKLQTFGGAALNTKANIILLGDAAAATGAPINELGFWVGRMYSSIQGGKPFGEAAMRLQELAVMTPQARDKMEAMQKSGASASEVFKVFKDSLGQFTGAMTTQAGTWEGVMSTFTDTVNMMMADVLKPYFEVIRDLGQQVNGALDSMSGSLGDVAKSTASTKQAFADLITSGLNGSIKTIAFLMVEFNAAKVVAGDLRQVIDGLRSGFMQLQRAAALGLLPGQVDFKRWKELDDQIKQLEVTMRERGKSLQQDKQNEKDWVAWGDKAIASVKEMTAHLGESSKVTAVHGKVTALSADELEKAAKAAKAKAEADKVAKKEASEHAAEVKTLNHALEDLGTVGDSWRGTLQGIDPLARAFALNMLKAGSDAGSLKTVLGLTDAQMKALQKSLADDKAFDKLRENVEKIEQGVFGLGEAIDKVGKSNTDIKFAEEWTKNRDAVIKVENGVFGLGDSIDKVGTKTRVVAEHLTTFDDVVGTLADTFIDLGRNSDGVFGSMIAQVGELLGLLGQSNQFIKQMGPGKDGTALSGGKWGLGGVMFDKNATRLQKAQAASAAIAAAAEGGEAVWDATDDHPTAAGNAGAGALAGAKAGAAFGPYGMAIGAAAGLIVGIVRGKPEWAKAAEDVGRDFGVKISNGLAHAIAEKAKSDFFGRRVVAELDALSQILAEGSGVTAKNFDQLAGKLRNVFPMIEMGWMSAAQGAKILDENWSAFVAAGTDGAGRLNGKLKEMITLDQTMGTQSKEIAAYLKAQGSAAVEGFNAVVAGTAAAAAGYAAYKQAVDSTAVSSQAHALALHDQAEAAEGARGELSDLGIQAIATYAAMVASGSSSAEALQAIGPALTTLQKSYEDLGLNVDNVALKNLMMQNTINQGNPALISAIAGLNQQLIALDNMGLLNIETFGAMERTGFQMYTRLQGEVAKTGGSTRDALVPMQGWLQEAAYQAELLGIPLDANTQIMVDQSKELGIWKDKGKSAADAVTDAMKKLVDKVSELIDKLNGIPPKVNTTVTTTYESVYTGGDPGDPYNPYAATGGFASTRGIVQHFGLGGMVGSLIPNGTDTVPTMLTPGELVLNASQQGNLADRLHAASSGPVVDLGEIGKLREDIAASNARIEMVLRQLPQDQARMTRDAVIQAGAGNSRNRG